MTHSPAPAPDACREAFNRWVTDMEYGSYSTGIREDGAYSSSHTHLMWLAWQASRQASTLLDEPELVEAVRKAIGREIYAEGYDEDETGTKWQRDTLAAAQAALSVARQHIEGRIRDDLRFEKDMHKITTKKLNEYIDRVKELEKRQPELAATIETLACALEQAKLFAFAHGRVIHAVDDALLAAAPFRTKGE